MKAGGLDHDVLHAWQVSATDGTDERKAAERWAGDWWWVGAGRRSRAFAKRHHQASARQRAILSPMWLRICSVWLCVSLRKNGARGQSRVWKSKGRLSAPALHWARWSHVQHPTHSNANTFLLHSISSSMYFLGHRILCLLKPSVYLWTCFVSRIQS